MQVVFDTGETRHVKLRIRNVKNKPFAITSAKYEFYGKFDRNIIQSGQASVIDHIIDVVISPPVPGHYFLKYTYIIGDETLVDVVEVTAL